MSILLQDHLEQHAREEYRFNCELLEYQKQECEKLLQTYVQTCVNVANKRILAIKHETKSAVKLLKYNNNNKKLNKSEKKQLYLEQEEKILKVRQEANSFIVNLKNHYNYEIQRFTKLQQAFGNQLNSYLLSLADLPHSRTKQLKMNAMKAIDAPHRVKDNANENENDNEKYGKRDIREVREIGEISDQSSDYSNDRLNVRNNNSNTMCKCEAKEGESKHASEIECYIGKLNDASTKLLSKMKNDKANKLTTMEKDSIVSEYKRLAKKISEIDVLLSQQSATNKKTSINIEGTQIEKLDWRESDSIKIGNYDDISGSSNSSNDSWIEASPDASNSETNEMDKQTLEMIIKEETKKAIENAIKEAKKTGTRLAFSMKSKIKREIRHKYSKFMAKQENEDTSSFDASSDGMFSKDSSISPISSISSISTSMENGENEENDQNSGNLVAKNWDLKKNGDQSRTNNF